MFLAHLPAAQTAGVLATQQARQETHTPGAAALEKLLVKTRRDGIASSLHRMIYGMAGFGAPVFGPDRGLVLAIGLAMPARLLVQGNGSRPTGWPARSAAPPGRSPPNWDTARHNTPAPASSATIPTCSAGSRRCRCKIRRRRRTNWSEP
jgi:hypothetical protein